MLLAINLILSILAHYKEHTIYHIRYYNNILNIQNGKLVKQKQGTHPVPCFFISARVSLVKMCYLSFAPQRVIRATTSICPVWGNISTG